jgi:hypothetical protein
MHIDWAVGFVLGAIVSPPDAIAPLSIARRMQIPRRILVILEGEGLANDATALILYRFAVTAVSVGVFSFGQAAGTFAAIAAGEILWGIGVGWLGKRSADRNTAFGPHAVPRLLAPNAPRWLGRAGDRDCGTLHQFERSSVDKPGDPVTGRLLLGILHLCH